MAGLSRIPVARHLKMLRDGRMAGMVKLHRGDQPGTERQVWADHVWRTASVQIDAAEARRMYMRSD